MNAPEAIEVVPYTGPRMAMWSDYPLSDVLGFKAAFYGGSREICSPPPTDTDCDIVVLVRDVNGTLENLLAKGWESPVDVGLYGETECMTFATVRKGEYNMLITEHHAEFGAMWGATSFAKAQNVQSKESRYKLFELCRAPWRPVFIPKKGT